MNHKVIVGPPGTGKTRHLINEVEQFLGSTAGCKVLFVSHTKAAAQNAVERWGQPDPRLDISTLHSFCFKELKMSRAQVVDDTRLLEFVEQFGMDLEEGGDGRRYVDVMALCGSTYTSLEQCYVKNGSPGTWPHFQAFVKSYNLWKGQFGYKDFTDMLLHYISPQTRPTGHALLAIDEAQDLTPLHWKVVRRIMQVNPEMRVMVAGDEDQTIYSYSGADPQGMTKFQSEFSTGHEVLDQSYRVPRATHQVADRVIRRIGDRADVKYLPRDAEGGFTKAGEFSRLFLDSKASDTLILFNDKFIRKDVEHELLEAAIPYESISGMPAPLQTKAGRALTLAHRTAPLTPEELGQFKRALNDRGRMIMDSVGAYAVIDKLRGGSMDSINIHWSMRDYFGRVNFADPVRVRISTIHGAKGMEADEVHLLCAQSQAAVDSALKNPDAQHRLFYVGVTRARERLFSYEGENSYEL